MMLNKVTSITIGIIIVIALAIGFLLLNNGDTQESLQTTQPSTPSSTANTETMSESYVEYSESSFSSTNGQRILFFHAEWCPQCKALEADISNSTLPDGVTVFEVDYDTNQDLRQKYGVTLQTTLVSVDESGELINKFVAYDNPTWQNVSTKLL